MENSKPILFSTEMVRAILAGRKTQTRRIVKPLKGKLKISAGHIEVINNMIEMMPDKTPSTPIIFLQNQAIKLPYGKIGDKLCVRETWALPQNKEGDDIGYQYKADYTDGSELWKWHPSIHMPKEACRLFLKIKSIRVEKLKDISEADAFDEGVYAAPGWGLSQARFKDLWEKINGRGSWKKNPWVWVIEFKRVERTK